MREGAEMLGWRRENGMKMSGRRVERRRRRRSGVMTAESDG